MAWDAIQLESSRAQPLLEVTESVGRIIAETICPRGKKRRRRMSDAFYFRNSEGLLVEIVILETRRQEHMIDP